MRSNKANASPLRASVRISGSGVPPMGREGRKT
jgi:hypothetical protein